MLFAWAVTIILQHTMHMHTRIYVHTCKLTTYARDATDSPRALNEHHTCTHTADKL